VVTLSSQSRFEPQGNRFGVTIRRTIRKKLLLLAVLLQYE
jgi:hypothetical protein